MSSIFFYIVMALFFLCGLAIIVIATALKRSSRRP